MWSCTEVFWQLFRDIWNCSSAKSLWYMCCTLKCSGWPLNSWHCSWRQTTSLSYEWRTFSSWTLRRPTTICRQSIWLWASLLIRWCSRSGLKRPSTHGFLSSTVSWDRGMWELPNSWSPGYLWATLPSSRPHPWTQLCVARQALLWLWRSLATACSTCWPKMTWGSLLWRPGTTLVTGTYCQLNRPTKQRPIHQMSVWMWTTGAVFSG